MKARLDIPAVFVLILLPIILIIAAALYASNYGVTIFEILLLIVGYYISNITVGIGLHRLWAHGSYKTNKYIELILALFAAGTLQGPVLSWASNHFDHHTYTDTEKDPHSPLKFKSKVKGFFWSHMGWMLLGNGSYRSINKVTMIKLGKNKILRWQLKYYWQLAIAMNSIVPALVGYMVGGNISSAAAGVIFIGLGRALQQQVTFFVNSLCHFVGSRKYVKGTAGDIWWLAIFLLGENWHNFHHAFPSDYRNGAKWYQMDVHKWIIYLMSWLGLAWDLNKTAKVRVEAKMSQIIEQLSKAQREEITQIKRKVDELLTLYYQKISEFENSSIQVKDRIGKILDNVQMRLNEIASQLNQQLQNLEKPSNKLIRVITREIGKAEKSLQKLYLKLEAVGRA